MRRFIAIYILLVGIFLSCSSPQTFPPQQQDDDVDTMLQIQDAVIADVDTFFLSFSDTNYCIRDCYKKLGSELNSALRAYKDFSPERCDPDLKNASLNVCLTVQELYQNQFLQMIALDSALNSAFSEHQQQLFDSLSIDCFQKIEQAQNLVK